MTGILSRLGIGWARMATYN